MTQTHAVLEMEPLGIRVQVRRTAEETNGELFEMDVIGRPRAFLPSATSILTRPSAWR